MVERHVRSDIEMERLWKAIDLRAGVCVAFIGAGGKTTTMVAAAREAEARGLSVAITTTTKIWPPAGLPLVLEADEVDIVEAGRHWLQYANSIAVGRDVADNGKLTGLESPEVCRLAESKIADVVLCEADGAAGRSLKVHGDHEPIIPSCVTSVVLVAGLDAMGQSPGPDVIHRFDRYLATIEEQTCEFLGADTFADILLAASERIGPRLAPIFVLNKADDASTCRAGRQVAERIRARTPGTTVVMTSHQSDFEGEPIHVGSEAAGPAAHGDT